MSAARDYATEVMRIISDGTVRIGVWSERDRDAILRTLVLNYQTPYLNGLELIVDSSADFRLMQDVEDCQRVRLADYRIFSIGMDERADVAAVNAKLRAIPIPPA